MIEIVTPAIFTSIQDAGRFGYRRYGVPVSGPMDWFAFEVANLLVGNESTSACIEFGYSTLIIRTTVDLNLAVTGAGFLLLVNNIEMPLWTNVFCPQGSLLELRKNGYGNWAYLAIAGGIETKEYLGSRSAYALANFGEGISEGMTIACKSSQRESNNGSYFPKEFCLDYKHQNSIAVIPGPQFANLTEEASHDFWHTAFGLVAPPNRIALRLQGKQLVRNNTDTGIVSQAMTYGCIQVPSDGNPIVMLSDHPTTGGYMQVGVVTRMDIPILAQSGLEKKYYFKEIPVDEAVKKFCEIKKSLNQKIVHTEEDWMFL